MSRGAGAEESVHLRQFPEAPASWRDPALAEKWGTVRALRRVVTGALEVERREKRIGSSLEAQVTMYAAERTREALAGIDLAEIAITSAARTIEGPAPAGAFTVAEVADVAVVVAPAEGLKCQRCWQVLVEVAPPPPGFDGGAVCRRCSDAIATLSPATAE